MLFNSYIFLFVFLPVTFAGFYLIGARGRYRIATAWLVAASLFFYGYWNPAFLGLILGSIFFNYSIGMALSLERTKWRRPLLIFGVMANLGLLAYFKYAHFLVENLNVLAGTSFTFKAIVLPLGISFFTFTQIAFLTDAYRKEVKEYDLAHYLLFVTYFPHLIAGPILHHKDMMPQFARSTIYRIDWNNVAAGLTIIAIGLFKKVILADGIAPYAGPVFSAAVAPGQPLSLVEAWGGALAFSLQLYFDFSGYCDMAIGLSLLFNIRLPVNFHSPYKAVNIIDFWRRWHMTLSRFLRDYLYIPLGGSRKGPWRRYTNLLITMLIGGFWHGANWTFVAWGALHGLYLVVNHGWRTIREKLGQDISRSTRVGRTLSQGLTFLAVVVAWVFFRAENIQSAGLILKAMAGLNGVVIPEIPLPAVVRQWSGAHGIAFGNPGDLWKSWRELQWLLVLLTITFFAPNTQQVMSRVKPATGLYPLASVSRIQWSPTLVWSMFAGLIAYMSILNLTRVSEFLYFQF